MQIVALMPVLDDWPSAQEVIRHLGTVFAATPHTLSVMLVDDGSSAPPPAGFGAGPTRISVLRLKRNLGNQRALAVGMCHLVEKLPCDAVVVMDSDGQDEPADALRLVDRLAEEQAASLPGPIIFAERTVRSESLLFRAGYLGYRVLHYVLTGRGIRVGNFSVVPRARLAALTSDPKLWKHYAAAVVGGGVPFRTIPSRRGVRIEGQSRFGYFGHVRHGLMALSCYDEIIARRLFILCCFLFGLTAAGLTLVLEWIRFTPLWPPHAPWYLAAFLLMLLFQAAILLGLMTLQIIRAQSAPPFLPIRDYAPFVERFDPIMP